ncbi:hypothetical protein AAF712_014672 [Marasmius tenuissimus]|uniref:Protein kinase domain-containing protein n=1 Tax=Marasmius tenuissimus TaxID=585030 RepID=A0ABR2ZAS2_9AGAR
MSLYKPPSKEAPDGFPTQQGTGKLDASLKAGINPMSRKSEQKEESKETGGVEDKERKPPHKESTEQSVVVKDERKAANVDSTRKQDMESGDVKPLEKDNMPKAESALKVRQDHDLEASKQESKTLRPHSFQDCHTPNEVGAEADVIQGEESEDMESMGQAEGMGVDEGVYQIQALFEDAEQCRKIIETEGNEAQRWLDLLQALTGYPGIQRQTKSTIFKVMLRLSKKSGLYPKCLKINNVERMGSHPVAGGGFGDVWKGRIADEIVCLKVVKVYLAFDVQQRLKEYMQEAIVWQQLRHPNLLPFAGLYYLGEGQGQLCLVSPWMERGNLVTFLKNTPPENVDRVLLAYDVASGLAHLHDMKIVHGDMKGVNVLITPEGRALIGDFGLSHVADSHALKLSTSLTNQAKGTTRWLAPELLRSNAPVSTVLSDMYAYGCVCYEIFAGRVPFYELGVEGAVIVAILLDGKHPSRPQDIEVDDEIWELMTSCWNSDPSLRPTAADAFERIRRLWSSRGGSGDIQDASGMAFNVGVIRSSAEYPPLDFGLLNDSSSSRPPINFISHVRSTQRQSASVSILNARPSSGEPLKPEELARKENAFRQLLDDPKKYRSVIHVLVDKKAQDVLNEWQRLAECTPDANLRSHIIKAAIQLSDYSGLSPVCLQISGTVEDLSEAPVEHSGFADIRTGSIGGVKVGVKVIRRGLNSERYDQLVKVKDVAQALAYLHGLQITHGDLKDLNVLITAEYTACIADFGLSQVIDNQTLAGLPYMSGVEGPTRWLAPEIMKGGKLTAICPETDIYAFGCVCYEIYAKRAPFADIEEYRIYHIVVVQNQRPELPREVPDGMRRVIENCWRAEPGSRPKAARIVEEIDRMDVGRRAW